MDPERESYVGVFDILGFRDFVRRKPLGEAIKILEGVRRQAEEMAGVARCKSIQFSDTIVLYTEGTEPGQLEDLLLVSSYLIGEFLQNGIGLRGGIAKGPFYHNNTIFVGAAMIRAYDLEQSQEWIGGVVDPALIHEFTANHKESLKSFLDHELLYRWNAPVKGGSAGELYCIGWPAYYDHKKTTSEALELNGSEPWDVLRKASNTEAFRRDFSNRKWNVGKDGTTRQLS